MDRSRSFTYSTLEFAALAWGFGRRIAVIVLSLRDARGCLDDRGEHYGREVVIIMIVYPPTENETKSGSCLIVTLSCRSQVST